MNTGNSGPRSTPTSTKRSDSVVDWCAFCVATHQRPIEMAIVTTSLVRALSPSERRLTIFV